MQAVHGLRFWAVIAVAIAVQACVRAQIILNSWSIAPNYATTDTRMSVVSLGDVDADGFGDFVMGAPFPVATLNGTAQIYSGRTRLPFAVITGGSPSFGYSIDSGADVDGDGLFDIIVGEPGASGSAGAISVYSGRTQNLLRAKSGVLLGCQPGARFGETVALLGDLNGDGHSEFAGGAPFDAGPAGPLAGRAVVFDGASGAVIYNVTGGQPGKNYGALIARIGDMDRDGAPDFVITSPNTIHGGLEPLIR